MLRTPRQVPHGLVSCPFPNEEKIASRTAEKPIHLSRDKEEEEMSDSMGEAGRES